MDNSTLICPDCNSRDCAEMLYGFPLLSDHSDHTAYGGEQPQLATHFCTKCHGTWVADDTEARTIQCPRSCHFCGEELPEIDLLRFHTEYEGWAEKNTSKFCVEEMIFVDVPFPTCSDCREGIRLNIDSLEEERQREDADRIFMRRLYICAIAFIVIFLVVMVSLGY